MHFRAKRFRLILILAICVIDVGAQPSGAAVAQETGNGASLPYLGVWQLEDASVVFRFMPDKVAVLYRKAAFGHDFVNVYRVSYGEDGARLVRV